MVQGAVQVDSWRLSELPYVPGSHLYRQPVKVSGGDENGVGDIHSPCAVHLKLVIGWKEIMLPLVHDPGAWMKVLLSS